MTLTLVHLLPELLGTYGDRGNVEIASWRLRQRGIAHEVINVGANDRIPVSADLYFLGGGEDDAQIAAREILERDGAVRKIINNGGHIFAVCAGFQILGASFPASQNRTMIGLGILPIETLAGAQRSVGEILLKPTIDIATLSGFENHAGQTRFLDEAQPLGAVIHGVGNGLEAGADGIITDQVLATYMHGPAFARNPELADWFLSRKIGVLEKLDAPIFQQLHDERVASVK